MQFYLQLVVLIFLTLPYLYKKIILIFFNYHNVEVLILIGYFKSTVFLLLRNAMLKNGYYARYAPSPEQNGHVSKQYIF